MKQHQLGFVESFWWKIQTFNSWNGRSKNFRAIFDLFSFIISTFALKDRKLGKIKKLKNWINQFFLNVCFLLLKILRYNSWSTPLLRKIKCELNVSQIKLQNILFYSELIWNNILASTHCRFHHRHKFQPLTI